MEPKPVNRLGANKPETRATETREPIKQKSNATKHESNEAMKDNQMLQNQLLAKYVGVLLKSRVIMYLNDETNNEFVVKL